MALVSRKGEHDGASPLSGDHSGCCYLCVCSQSSGIGNMVWPVTLRGSEE